MTIEQQRLETLAAYAVEIRAAHPGDDAIGEIADQIELRAWGPIVLPAADAERTEEGK